jgi:hypothetical protein
VAAISEISINALEISNAILDDRTGELKWELDLKPQQQHELVMRYEVKYPRREKVLLE